MADPLAATSKKIREVLDRQGRVSLSQLEVTVEASYNLIFLALDRMASRREIRMERAGGDYRITPPGE